jgi:hypothetical protein
MLGSSVCSWLYLTAHTHPSTNLRLLVLTPRLIAPERRHKAPATFIFTVTLVREHTILTHHHPFREVAVLGCL